MHYKNAFGISVSTDRTDRICRPNKTVDGVSYVNEEWNPEISRLNEYEYKTSKLMVGDLKI